ncbi:PAS/PAC sensor hybrid histidine kinase [Caballeronia cordobensis]|uniref:histidine kinase n=2 Tax=Caballeronia cordobensis TaxID=1353886 RepID=A0A158I4V2_CABCO|nr:PAS/PAC sensor hybrid histidine kinase [Caballeronia cordobensis]
MFYQGEPKTGGGVSGLGIGLAVVRDFVSRHGGAVSAYSDGPGRGTRITIELPINPDAAIDADKQPTSSVATRRALILVADDNMDAADALSEVLRIEGHEVITAYDGQSAREMAGRA